ncbi:MAG: hypothetical protein HYV07_18545 [Deltaproteobacteria bacterium]|nr:hypothetical protein [Deltaproteobacteria bacterium]
MRPLSVAAALVLLEGAASAHDFPVRRTLLLEPGQTLDVLVHLAVPAKKRAVFLAFGDANRDGRIDEAESKALRSLLLARALTGLDLLVDGAKRPLDQPETKVHLDSTRVELVVHGSLVLPRGEATVSIRTSSPGDPLELRIVGRSRKVAREAVRRSNGSAVRARIRRGSLAVQLGAEDVVEVRIPALGSK